MAKKETIYTPGAMVVFNRDGTHRSVSLLEAERVRHPWFSEEELIRRAEWQLAQRQGTSLRDGQSASKKLTKGAE